MRRHTNHTATAPSSHSPSRILVPSRQPRRNERKVKEVIVTLLAVRCLVPSTAGALAGVDTPLQVPVPAPA
jgi:hypothetical protein